MAQYTLASVTFNAAQEAGLDRKLFLRNQSRAAAGLPAQTKQQYLDSLVQAWPQQFVTEFRDDLTQRCGAVIQTASVATLVDVTNVLGVDINPYD